MKKKKKKKKNKNKNKNKKNKNNNYNNNNNNNNNKRRNKNKNLLLSAHHSNETAREIAYLPQSTKRSVRRVGQTNTHCSIVH